MVSSEWIVVDGLSMLLPKAQSLFDSCHYFHWCLFPLLNDGFAGRRFFKRGNLTCEERGVHEVQRRSLFETRREKVLIDTQEHEPNMTWVGAEHLPIGPLERGACNNRTCFFVDAAVDTMTHTTEPGHSVLVIQGDACAQLVDVGWWVQIICLEEFPAQVLREETSYRRLPAPRHSHYHHDHGSMHNATLTETG